MTMIEYPDDPDPARTDRLRGYDGRTGATTDWGAAKLFRRIFVVGGILGIIRWLTG